ncbi:MAG: putative quinol monooxygenase [Pseudomonadota bacterium]
MSYCVSVLFEVNEPHIAAFAARLRDQAAASLEEPGCSCFDLWTDPDRPEAFYLYEIYDDRAAFDAHLVSAHFLAFNAEIREWVYAKRVETFASRMDG